jgi:hypothetical protein
LGPLNHKFLLIKCLNCPKISVDVPRQGCMWPMYTLDLALILRNIFFQISVQVDATKIFLTPNTSPTNLSRICCNMRLILISLCCACVYLA